MPTSLTEPIGAPSPDAVLPASIVTASGEAPVPWICRLQRMHGPASGMSWRSSSGGCGTGVFVSDRPRTAIRFWSFGQWNW